MDTLYVITGNVVSLVIADVRAVQVCGDASSQSPYAIDQLMLVPVHSCGLFLHNRMSVCRDMGCVRKCDVDVFMS